MKRIACLITAVLFALLILAPAAVAQEEDMMMKDSDMMQEQPKMDESMMQEQPKMDQSKMMEQPKMMEKSKMMEMPKTGGPALGSLLVPSAVLLVGSGIMGAYLIRQRG